MKDFRTSECTMHCEVRLFVKGKLKSTGPSSPLRLQTKQGLFESKKEGTMDNGSIYLGTKTPSSDAIGSEPGRFNNDGPPTLACEGPVKIQMACETYLPKYERSG